MSYLHSAMAKLHKRVLLEKEGLLATIMLLTVTAAAIIGENLLAGAVLCITLVLVILIRGYFKANRWEEMLKGI